jgi:tRNA pseudouridine-54 N-methylase
VATQPRAPSPAQAVGVGKTLNEVEDPLSATRLQVIRFNEDTSSLSDFEVAQVDGVWVIPSHQDYPADAEQHMADAAMSVMNLQILGVASTNRAKHATYGAIDPDIEKL